MTGWKEIEAHLIAVHGWTSARTLRLLAGRHELAALHRDEHFWEEKYLAEDRNVDPQARP